MVILTGDTVMRCLQVGSQIGGAGLHVAAQLWDVEDTLLSSGAARVHDVQDLGGTSYVAVVPHYTLALHHHASVAGPTHQDHLIHPASYVQSLELTVRRHHTWQAQQM